MTCKICMHHEHDKDKARKHFIEMSNEINRLRSKLEKQGDTIDIESAYRPTLRPIRVNEDTVTESQCWTYAVMAFILGFFVGAVVTWGGF